MLKKFIPSLDNLSGVHDVYSILVAPIFGHRKDDSASKDGNNIVGVLQLINKIDNKITPSDIVSPPDFLNSFKPFRIRSK